MSFFTFRHIISRPIGLCWSLSWFELLTFRQIIPPDRAVTIGQLQVLFTRGTLLAPADDTERHGSTVGILAWGRNS